MIQATEDFICFNVSHTVIGKPDIPKPTVNVSHVLRITTIPKQFNIGTFF